MFPSQCIFPQKSGGEKAQLVKLLGWWAKVGFAAFLFLFIPAVLPQEKPCCSITDIDTGAVLVSAKVNTTGQTFQFKPNTPGLLASLKVGEGVYANFKTGQVSVNRKDIVGTIVSLGPAKGPLTPATPSKAPSPPPGPQQGTSPSTAGGGPPQGGPLAPPAGRSAACCGITSVDERARLAAAKVNSTGQVFEFSVPNSVPIQSLHTGQPVWANFKTMQVSLNGQTACCRIVSGSPQQASKPGLMAPAGATPKVGATGSSSATNAPASAGQPITGAAPVTSTGVAQLGLNASAQLCTVIACQQAPRPIITQVNPASVIKPGGAVLLRGTNFMAADGSFGKVVLILMPATQSSSTGFQSAAIYMASKYPLENAQWGDTAAYGTISANITGVTDQPATFEILRSDGLTSAPFTPPSMPFTATRDDMVMLPMGDVQVKCSQAADQNQCNGWADYSPPLSLPFPYPGPYGTEWLDKTTTLSAHNAFLTKESGEDQFSFNLKNGWVFEAFSIGGVGDCGPYSTPDGWSSQGTASWSWTADPSVGGSVRCFFFLWINGPRGVPWK